MVILGTSNFQYFITQILLCLAEIWCHSTIHIKYNQMNENTCLDFTKLSGAHIRKHCLDDFLFVHSVNKTEFFWFWVTNFGNTGSLFSSYGFINSVIFCNFPFQMGTTAVCSYITADPLTHRSSQQIFWLNFPNYPSSSLLYPPFRFPSPKPTTKLNKRDKFYYAYIKN